MRLEHRPRDVGSVQTPSKPYFAPRRHTEEGGVVVLVVVVVFVVVFVVVLLSSSSSSSSSQIAQVSEFIGDLALFGTACPPSKPSPALGRASRKE